MSLIVEVPIKYRLLTEAQEEAEKLGKLNGSIREGGGNIYGILGELLVADLIGAEVKNTYDYDLIYEGVTVDVKTKACTSKPQLDYDCSIAAFNIRQKCNYYLFTRILNNFSRAWILGYISKERYFAKARFCKEGEIDVKSGLGWRFKADCYNLEISELQPLAKRFFSKINGLMV